MPGSFRVAPSVTDAGNPGKSLRPCMSGTFDPVLGVARFLPAGVAEEGLMDGAGAHRDEARGARLGDVEFDDLLREVLARVEGVLDEQARLRLLLDAVVTMAADLTLDGVLARIVSIASSLVDARYAALGRARRRARNDGCAPSSITA